MSAGSVAGVHPAIQVKGVAKQYRIGVRATSGGLYDKVGRLVRRGSGDREQAPTIWALRGVTFDVPPGQVLGVVGRNGSGKSTLMKILSRVTVPTEGEAIVRGRVGALLQVGTGFHPELSGRDNIGLAGAILGMRAQEIEARQDEIIAFSEIDRFLDTPVKHYSSGMFMRLAFSVSAHLPAEVLLVDEALSVGDAAFQEKCKRRIRDLVREGRTVLFVSHSTETLVELCDSAIVLDAGSIVQQGDTVECMRFYEREVLGLARDEQTDFSDPNLMARLGRQPVPRDQDLPVASGSGVVTSAVDDG